MVYSRPIKTHGNIDIDSEEVISLAEARHLFKPSISLSRVVFYSNEGLAGVVLESVVSHGQKMTSVEAVERFKARQQKTGTHRRWS